MNIKEYIESGILELYLSGGLSDSEAKEVKANLIKHPELQEELERLEQIFIESSAIAGNPSEGLFDKIESAIDEGPHPSSGSESKGSGINKLFIGLGILGLGFGLFAASKWMQKNRMVDDLNNDKVELQALLDDCQKSQQDQDILFAARLQATNTIMLSGQTVSPSSFAVVHWNTNNNSVIVDASGLPTPPSGKDYQLWSLKMDPLTPTDAGVLVDFETNESLLFETKEVAEAEGFAITLEPEGGSESPSLDQLYVLGTI